MTVGKKLLFACGVLPLAAVLLLGVSPLAAEVFVEGDLRRQAALGFRAVPGERGLAVSGLAADSAAAQAGIREGDILVAVNGEQFEKPYAGAALLEKLKGGDRTTLTLSRDNRERQVAFTPAGRPFEAIEGVDSYYVVVDAPDGARGILAQLARRSGMVLVRVERTTSGDSEGPACHELDYDTEVAHYIHAFDELLRRSPHLDSDRIVVHGSSLGNTTAPLVALALQQRGHKIDGVAVGGGGAVTYLERMLWFDRWYLERRPQEVDVRAIHDEILRRVRFHYEYLVNGRSPDDVAGDSGEMAAVRRDVLGLGDGVHYGRPYAYHQQAAKKNFLAAWAEVEAAALVVYAEFDQYEQRHGHAVIVDVVNRLRPGTARYVELKNTNHDYWVFANEVDAYADVNGVAAPELLIGGVLEWLRSEVGIGSLAGSQ